jgi:hypothetical protein
MKLDRSNGAASTRMEQTSTMPLLPLKTFTWDRIDPTTPSQLEEQEEKPRDPPDREAFTSCEL